MLLAETKEKRQQRTEREEMVTTCNGACYSQAELRAAFSLVENVDNWKAPVDAWINASLWPLVSQAVIHFTGSVPTIPEVEMNGRVIPLSPSVGDIASFAFTCRVHVRAAGYYSACGA